MQAVAYKINHEILQCMYDMLMRIVTTYITPAIALLDVFVNAPVNVVQNAMECGCPHGSVTNPPAQHPKCDTEQLMVLQAFKAAEADRPTQVINMYKSAKVR